MANVKISELPAATSGADANEFEINETGTSKKLTGSLVKSYVLSSPTATGTLTVPTLTVTTGLGADLDTNGQDIVTSSNADLDLAPDGTGKVVIRGNDNSAKLVLNCEVNSHGVTIASPPHSDAATYSVSLPSTLGLTQASAFVTSDSNGVVTFDNGISEEYIAVTSSSNATTVNLRDGTNFSHTLTENTTFTFSNPASSGKVSSFTLKLVQDSSASGYTVTWPSSVDWPSATAPTLTATASAVDYFVFITHDGGTTFYGFTAGQALG